MRDRRRNILARFILPLIFGIVSSLSAVLIIRFGTSLGWQTIVILAGLTVSLGVVGIARLYTSGEGARDTIEVASDIAQPSACP